MYRIISGNKEYVEKEVTQCLSEGWVPYGNPFCSTEVRTYIEREYTAHVINQAMVTKEYLSKFDLDN